MMIYIKHHARKAGKLACWRQRWGLVSAAGMEDTEDGLCYYLQVKPKQEVFNTLYIFTKEHSLPKHTHQYLLLPLPELASYLTKLQRPLPIDPDTTSIYP